MSIANDALDKQAELRIVRILPYGPRKLVTTRTGHPAGPLTLA